MYQSFNMGTKQSFCQNRNFDTFISSKSMGTIESLEEDQTLFKKTKKKHVSILYYLMKRK